MTPRRPFRSRRSATTQSPSTGPPTYHGSWWWSIGSAGGSPSQERRPGHGAWPPPAAARSRSAPPAKTRLSCWVEARRRTRAPRRARRPASSVVVPKRTAPAPEAARCAGSRPDSPQLGRAPPSSGRTTTSWRPAEPRAGDGGGEEGRASERPAGGAHAQQEAAVTSTSACSPSTRASRSRRERTSSQTRDEGQRAHGRPQEQPLGRADPQPHEPRPALEVGGQAVGAGRALALGQHGVRASARRRGGR